MTEPQQTREAGQSGESEQAERQTRRKTTTTSGDDSSGSQRRPSSSEGRPAKRQAKEQRTQRKPAQSTSGSSDSSAGQRQSTSKLTARRAAAAALRQLQELTTRTPESVVGIESGDGVWVVTVEVVESARIPDTADIMTEYEVSIDQDGEMVGYTRGDRYSRGRTRTE